MFRRESVYKGKNECSNCDKAMLENEKDAVVDDIGQF